MYIKPISKFPTSDIVEANYFRRLEVSKVINNTDLVNNIFNKLRIHLDSSSIKDIEDILSYELFFELIPNECIIALISSYNSYDNKSNYINSLKKSYTTKGDRGFIFSFMPVISKRALI